MSSVRTQIYLTQEQRSRISECTEATGQSLADVVRRAIDRYLEEEQRDPTSALAATFGADPEAKAPDRDEWERG